MIAFGICGWNECRWDCFERDMQLKEGMKRVNENRMLVQ
jgi:hypothetical protein